MNSPNWNDTATSATEQLKEVNTKSVTNEEEQDRSYHPAYVRKKAIRVKVRMRSGLSCIGYCHVLWPDGRTSDVINDERAFFILTDASVEGEHTTYNILTLRKEHIEFMCEIHHQHVSPKGESNQ